MGEVFSALGKSLKADKTLRTALLAVFVLGISEGFMNSKYWVWTIQDLGYGTPFAIALIVALQSFSRVAGQEFFVRVIKGERARFLTALFGISLITFLLATKLPPIVLAGSWMIRIFVYSSYFPLLNKELESIAHPSTVSTVLSVAPMLNAIGAIIGGLTCAGFQMESQSTFITMGALCALSGFLWTKAFSIKVFFQNKTLASTR